MNTQFDEYLEVLGFEKGLYQSFSDTSQPQQVNSHLDSTRILMLGKHFDNLKERPSNPALLLDKMIQAMGVTLSEIKFLELDSHIENIKSSIQKINPEAVILWALENELDEIQNWLPELKALKRSNDQPIHVLITHHPEACLHNPQLKKPVWDDLQIIMKNLGIKK